MRRQNITRGAGIGLLIALVLASVALAQTTVDPNLQGRVLRKSDGSLYIYKDGARYPIVPADLTDAQIDAIPQVGLQVVRVNDLFAMPSDADTTGLAASTSSASTPPALVVAPGTGPLAATLAALVGQTASVCDLLGNPLTVQVERAEQIMGTDQRTHVLLIVNVTNVGTDRATGYPPVELRDSQGRLYDRTATGLGQSLAELSRQYGLPGAAEQVLPPGVAERQLWTFQVPDDVQGLTLAQNPQTRCAAAGTPQ
ncbi:MAG TPA: hypothetical protein VK066_30595 [Chloroflexota bacterium]|nr:hypothetical protein [Chloroflexota bacterium]